MELHHPVTCELLKKHGAYWYAKARDEEAVEQYLKRRKTGLYEKRELRSSELDESTTNTD